MNKQRVDPLQEANERLNHEVEELRRRLEAAERSLRAERAHESSSQAEALDHVNRHKEEFLSRLAHDLRNPLAPLQNAVELLRLPDATAAQKQRALDIIDGQARNLRKLLDDLLDHARVTQGKIDLRKAPVALADVVAESVEYCRPLIERRMHRLTVVAPPEPVWVNADATRLQQVVSHLLENAAKYTDEGGRIHLAVTSTEDEIELRVEDNGIGIEPELLPGVFDLFAKMDRPRNPARAGLGIGLTMVRKLVELHGGRAEGLSSGCGQGSIFVIRLPRLCNADRLQAASGESIDSLLRQRSCRILIVSDDREFAEEWSLLLRVAGHDVHIAESAAAALDAARRLQPQVISLDIGSSEVDRDGLPSRMREQTGLEKVLVVAIGEDDPEDTGRRAAGAGCDALLTKPVKVQDFLRLIASRTNA